MERNLHCLCRGLEPINGAGFCWRSTEDKAPWLWPCGPLEDGVGFKRMWCRRRWPLFGSAVVGLRRGFYWWPYCRWCCRDLLLITLMICSWWRHQQLDQRRQLVLMLGISRSGHRRYDVGQQRLQVAKTREMKQKKPKFLIGSKCYWCREPSAVKKNFVFARGGWTGERGICFHCVCMHLWDEALGVCNCWE